MEALANHLDSEGGQVMHISTIPSFLARYYPSNIWRLFRFLFLIMKAFLILLLFPSYKKIYLNVNGGIALIFDICISVFAVFFSKKITLHHNSCSYLNKKSKLFNLLTKITNNGKAIHVVNCESMKQKLLSSYGVKENKINIISNISILSKRNRNNGYKEFKEKISKDNNFCVGFMGYLNREKGLDDFAEVLTKLQVTSNKNKFSFIGKAVGPTHDHKLIKNLRKNTSSFITYKDALYGDKRDSFFDNIDILLFPSKYFHEAEPLTVYHALERGVPVIGTDVGCLNEMIAGYENSFTFNQKNFIENAVATIKQISNKNRKELQKMKRMIINQYEDQMIRKEENFRLFLNNQING